MHGRGVYTHQTGDVYDGEFLDNEMSGIGTYRTADGQEIKGARRSRVIARSTLTHVALRHVPQW